MTSVLPLADWRDIFKKNTIPEISISENRIKGYTLENLISTELGRRVIEERIAPDKAIILPLDYSPPGFTVNNPEIILLRYKGKIQAVLQYSNDRPYLKIIQVQGARPIKVDPNPEAISPVEIDGEREKAGGARGLYPLNWFEFMVEFIEAYAKKHFGCERSIILDPSKNPSISAKVPEIRDRAMRLYRKGAERMGYERSRAGNWIKEL